MLLAPIMPMGFRVIGFSWDLCPKSGLLVMRAGLQAAALY